MSAKRRQEIVTPPEKASGGSQRNEWAPGERTNRRAKTLKLTAAPQGKASSALRWRIKDNLVG